MATALPGLARSPQAVPRKAPLRLAAVIALATVSAAGAATIYQDQNNASGNDWFQASIWSNDQSPSAANDYVSSTPGYTLRSPGSVSSSFGGNSLTIDGTQLNLTGAISGPGTVTIADLRLTGGGTIVSANGSQPQSLTGGLAVNGNGFFRLHNSTPARNITVSSQITGNGNIGLMQNGTLTLSGAGNTFSGLWTVGGLNVSILGTNYSNTSTLVSTLNATSQGSLGMNASLVANDYSIIRVSYDWETAGSVTLNLNSVTYLDTNWTVGALTINGTSLGAGTYSYSYLNANYDAFFNTTGLGGSITVVPEPHSLGLILLGSIGAALWGRRLRKSMA